MKKNIVIHPGFGKTGTSTLQSALFSVHPRIHNVGKPYTDNRQTHLRLRLLALEGINDEPQRRRLLFEKTLDASPPDRPTLVFSEEALTANPYQTAIVARRLHEVWPHASILFTIRHQLAALVSFYCYHGRLLLNVPAPYEGRHVRLTDWLRYHWGRPNRGALIKMDFLTTIRVYENLFGREAITIVLFEDMVHHPSRFAQTLSRGLQIPADDVEQYLKGRHENPRISEAEYRYRSWRSRFLPGRSLKQWIPFGRFFHKQWKQWIQSQTRADIPLPSVWEKRLTRFYAEHNAILQQEYGLPLAEYHYPLPRNLKKSTD